MNDFYDFVILGTAVTQSIIARFYSFNKSLLSKHYKIIHMDKNYVYGENSQFINKTEFYSKKNTTTSTSTTSSNKNIKLDSSPNLLLSNGVIVNLLIKQEIADYLEFKSVDQIDLFINQKLEKVPSSKEDIFINKSLTLLQKRSLMKLLKDIYSIEKLTKIINS